MNRREFMELNLRVMALGLVPAGLLWSCTKSPTSSVSGSSASLAHLGVLMSASHQLSADGRSTLFYYYDLAREKIDEIEMPLEFPHVAVGHPQKRNLVFVPESGGRNACLIDLKQKKVVRQLEAGKGRVFGGHGAFLLDGSRLYCSEFEPPPSGKGFVSIWNAEDFTRIGSFPSGGRFPHDVAIIKGGKTMTASNLGVEEGPHVKSSGTFVSLIDLKTQKLIERVELNENEAEMTGAEDPVMRTDARYFISYMQVANPDFRMFFYAHSHQPVVAIWDIHAKRLFKEFRFDEQPRALVLTYTKSHIAVVLGSGKIHFIDLKTKEIDHSLAARLPLKVTTHVNHWWDFDSAPPVPRGAGPGGYS